jgi:homoserine O-acetyltransferase
MAKTAAWSVVVNETSRAALMADPAWDGQRFTAVPKAGWRAWTGVLRMLAGRSPRALAHDFPDGAAALARYEATAADTLAMNLDPLDWIYQSYAYDAHDVARHFGGDLRAALATVAARTLIIAADSDLYNPAAAARAAADLIRDARYVELATAQGHQAATAASKADVAEIGDAIASFFTTL